MTGLVVGVGFSSSADALEIASLVGSVLAGRRADALAVPGRLACAPALVDAAWMLSLPVRAVEDDAIEAVQDRCLTRPCRAIRAVAEGAALVGAGPGASLLGPRRKGRRVTAALAAGPAGPDAS